MTTREDRITELERRCVDGGVPMTLQRRAILEALVARQDHPTADEVLADLAGRIEGVSRATVYRTLEALVDLGLSVRVCHPGAAARYDMKTERHHHLVCDRCGRIVDFDEPALENLPLPDFSGTGFQVRDYSVHVRGSCADCASSSVRDTNT